MKYLKPILFFLITCFVFNSCKKDQNEKIEVQESFRLNGVLVTVPAPEAWVASNTLHIATASCPVIINCDAKIGTYNLVTDIFHVTTEQLNTLSVIYSPSNSVQPYDYYLSTSGSLTISELSATVVSGTFQSTCTSLTGDIRYITDGQFTIKLSSNEN
ncbi:MAG: hypothetical protein JWP37_854 [Mucilaginibacter sp.]|nr:hypothetical protein [Mucilaginibacter sp.]